MLNFSYQRNILTPTQLYDFTFRLDKQFCSVEFLGVVMAERKLLTSLFFIGCCNLFPYSKYVLIELEDRNDSGHLTPPELTFSFENSTHGM